MNKNDSRTDFTAQLRELRSSTKRRRVPVLKSCFRVILVGGILFVAVCGLILLVFGDEIKAFAESAWGEIMGSSIGGSYSQRTREEVDLSWEEMGARDVTYNMPTLLQQGTPYRFNVYVNQPSTSEHTRSDSNQSEGSMGQTKVGTWMTVVMQANTSHFSLRSLSSDTQAVVGDALKWEWEAVPVKSGTAYLDILVSTKFNLEDGTTVSRDTLSQQVECQVGRSPAWLLKTFLDKHWKWILGSPLVAALALWIWKLFLANKTKESRSRQAGF